ncbi:hypothetical protein [Helicobacter sp. T3_23-1056]
MAIRYDYVIFFVIARFCASKIVAIYNQKLQKSVVWQFVIVDCHANASAFARNDENADSHTMIKRHKKAKQKSNDCLKKLSLVCFSRNDKMCGLPRGF